MTITYTRVFPINVNAIEVVVLDEVGNVGRQLHAVGGRSSLAKDLVRLGLCRKVPSTKRENLLGPAKIPKVVELVLRHVVANADLVVGRNVAKAKVQVRVLGLVNLQSVLEETLSLELESLVVADAAVLGGRVSLDDLGAAVGDAAVGAGLGCARGAGAGVGAELVCRAALSYLLLA